MAEFYCQACRKWNAGASCTGCLRIDPAQARWMTEREIRAERKRAVAA